MQVSGIQLYHTSSVYCIVCSPPHAKCPISIYPLTPLSLWYGFKLMVCGSPAQDVQTQTAAMSLVRTPGPLGGAP